MVKNYKICPSMSIVKNQRRGWGDAGMGRLEGTGMRGWGDKEIGRKKPTQKFKQ